MNKIYWDKDKISILTDQIEAVPHKHWAIQLFLCMDNELDICISKESIHCKCIVVNQNISHSFSTDCRYHFSVIFEPSSHSSDCMSKIMAGNAYRILDHLDISEMQTLATKLIFSNDLAIYHSFMKKLYLCLGMYEHVRTYDQRIEELLYDIEYCNCDTHAISAFADKASLSPCRLSHLFREQVGMPLKSYIQFHQMQKSFLALLNGQNITEAAMLTNFDTPSHFAAVTKKMMGMPASISLKNSVFLKVSDT